MNKKLKEILSYNSPKNIYRRLKEVWNKIPPKNKGYIVYLFIFTLLIWIMWTSWELSRQFTILNCHIDRIFSSVFW